MDKIPILSVRGPYQAGVHKFDDVRLHKGVTFVNIFASTLAISFDYGQKSSCRNLLIVLLILYVLIQRRIGIYPQSEIIEHPLTSNPEPSYTPKHFDHKCARVVEPS